MTKQIYLDDSCINTIISETPYIKILSIPKQDKNGIWTALAQVNSSLAVVELKVTIKE